MAALCVGTWPGAAVSGLRPGAGAGMEASDTVLVFVGARAAMTHPAAAARAVISARGPGPGCMCLAIVPMLDLVWTKLTADLRMRVVYTGSAGVYICRRPFPDARHATAL